MLDPKDGFKRLEVLNLWSTPDKIWIESNKLKTIRVLQITKNVSGATISLEPNQMQIPASASRKTIYGIIGMAELPLGLALIVITQRVNLGEIRGSNVFRLDCSEIIPINLSGKNGGVEALKMEAQRRCYSLLAEILSTPYFYFSYDCDITNTLQRLNSQTSATDNKEAWERLDRRFVWNDYLLRPFLDLGPNANDIYAFLTPVVHGAIFIRRCSINNELFTWGIITRRSRFRAGTRFFVRGADADGNVANFNETEQIVEVKGKGATSYVQTRGSMPMLWTQKPDLRYKPDPVLCGMKDEPEAVFAAHFKAQTQVYGSPQVAINLIDQRKGEGVLEAKFRSLMESSQLEGLVYEYFDFHKECSKMRYERLSVLMDRLAKYDLGYFHVDYAQGVGVSCLQQGVFRTNCMDCLDRTNVVQSMLAADNLVLALMKLGVFPANSTVGDLEKASSFHKVFRNTWADHANLISVQYAGTGALKTDFTRTGKRTKYGLLQDGWNSAVRYFKNNFSDGFRTDAMQFFLGDLQVSDIEDGVVAAKYRKESISSLTANLPRALLLAVVTAVLALIMSPQMNAGSSLALTFICFALVGICVRQIFQNNELFVNFPLQCTKECGRGG